MRKQIIQRDRAPKPLGVSGTRGLTSLDRARRKGGWYAALEIQKREEYYLANPDGKIKEFI